MSNVDPLLSAGGLCCYQLIKRLTDHFLQTIRKITCLKIPYLNNVQSHLNKLKGPEKHLINVAIGIVRFNQYRLSGTLPQALIIICEECSLFSC